MMTDNEIALSMTTAAREACERDRGYRDWLTVYIKGMWTETHQPRVRNLRGDNLDRFVDSHAQYVVERMGRV